MFAQEGAMKVTSSSSVRELLREHPESRAVFEEHGLIGCGGREGPDEPVAVFAQAHGVEEIELVRELRAATCECCRAKTAQHAAPTPAEPEPEPEPEAESYRYYLRAAVLVGIFGGAALGAIALTHLAVWGFTGTLPRWGWWAPLVQAHGNA